MAATSTAGKDALHETGPDTGHVATSRKGVDRRVAHHEEVHRLTAVATWLLVLVIELQRFLVTMRVQTRSEVVALHEPSLIGPISRNHPLRPARAARRLSLSTFPEAIIVASLRLARMLAAMHARTLTARLLLILLVAWLSPASAWTGRGAGPVYDIVVYGGTSGGLAAAIQARRMNLDVVLIEPTQRIGGLTTGGLGQTDIGNKQAIGGLSREFYRRIARHYQDPATWRWQTRDAYRSEGQSRTDPGEDTLWTFEPSAALKVYQDMVREAGLEVIPGERLDLEGGVATTRTRPWRIVSIRMESGRVFRGRMFIDATYEGDLMARAGVSYTVGREANSRYGETLNGVQTQRALKHQIVKGVDPYVRPGDPSSGLLPGLDPSGPGREGEADRRVQAYCFRMCLTDHPENRLPLVKPEGYDEQEYELLFRNFETGFSSVPWNNSAMPNRKTDINNNYGVSTDYIGMNYAYPEGDYAVRARIVDRHRRYQQGLVWTLAHHPRVPEEVRREVSRWGPCRDEFREGGGWQEQLYIREARRMVGAMVMTQHHCQGGEVVPDAVGLAAYTMDSHNVQRHVDASGHARNEGDVQVGGFPPYPISYRALVPQTNECSNLLVPVCLSASHIAFGSIRMEPVFMVLGQSAATAAALALERQVAVQQVDYASLQDRLLADGQVLAHQGRARVAGRDPATLPGRVMDDTDPSIKRQGFESASTSVQGFVGRGYCHDDNMAKGEQWMEFVLPVREAGDYVVRLGYTAHPNRATRVPVTVSHAGGETRREVNEREAPKVEGLFTELGTYRFEPGRDARVRISNAGTDGYVVVDAVQWLPATPPGEAKSK